MDERRRIHNVDETNAETVGSNCPGCGKEIRLELKWQGTIRSQAECCDYLFILEPTIDYVVYKKDEKDEEE